MNAAVFRNATTLPVLHLGPTVASELMRAAAVITVVLLLAALGWWLTRSPQPAPALVAQEGCLSCHDEAREGPGGLHSALADCEACHLGDAQALSIDAAHRGLERQPGALDTAAKTCGRGGCHPGQLSRVQGSLMATARGLIAVNRWGFGELAVPSSTQTAAQVQALHQPSPAQDHLRRLCLGCHLGARKENRDDMLVGTASGCSACHYAPRPTASSPHPIVDLAPPDQRCFGCHSRSGRVSLSYQGWHEVRGPELKACQAPLRLEDGRQVCQTQDDVHHAAGIACVDCHLHTEVMGDGIEHLHEEQQVQVRCDSCHASKDTLQTTWGEVEDSTSRRLLALNDKTVQPETAVRTGRLGTPLWNLEKVDEAWVLNSKLGAGRFVAKATPSDEQHNLPGHERLACSTCHSAWAPRCPTCHTSYDPDSEQWDFGTSTVAKGRWVEHAERYFATPPTLAERAGQVVTSAPGMIATLDARAAGGARKQTRWFAAFDPHTTVKQGRSCESCHNNPVALGYGRGRLQLRPTPRFFPADGGPMNRANEDGWQDLLQIDPAPGTRPDVHALSYESQWRALRVGACLECHRFKKGSIFSNFSEALLTLNSKKARSCRGWDHAWLRALPEGSSAR